MEVDLDGVNNYVDFEVIEILDDKDPYLALLRIDWDFDHYAILNLAADVFEKGGPLSCSAAGSHARLALYGASGISIGRGCPR